MTFYDKSIWEELVRIREVLALQTTLMGFNTMRGGEMPESDEAWLLEIITKAETKMKCRWIKTKTRCGCCHKWYKLMTGE